MGTPGESQKNPRGITGKPVGITLEPVRNRMGRRRESQENLEGIPWECEGTHRRTHWESQGRP